MRDRLPCKSKVTIFSLLQSLTSHRLLNVYANVFRSKIVAEESQKDFFFLTMAGKRMLNLGRCLTRFFKNHGDLHITTTIIRSIEFLSLSHSFHRKMQHTFAHDAVLNQRISEGSEEALTLTQGHSRQTAQEFYVMRQMEKAADTASSAHKRLYGEVAIPNIPLARGDDEEFLPSLGLSPLIRIN